MRPSRPVEERFWEKVDKSGECWEWTASRNASGYGQFQMGRANVAHRVAWMLANGPIPKGLFVLHSCDNRPCVRIDHLRLGTPKENGHDQVLRDRKPKHYDTYVSIHDAAWRLGVRVDTLRQQIHRGRLQGFKSATWNIRESELARYRQESLGKNQRRRPGPLRWRKVEAGVYELVQDDVVVARAHRNGSRFDGWSWTANAERGTASLLYTAREEAVRAATTK